MANRMLLREEVMPYSKRKQGFRTNVTRRQAAWVRTLGLEWDSPLRLENPVDAGFESRLPPLTL